MTKRRFASNRLVRRVLAAAACAGPAHAASADFIGYSVTSTTNGSHTKFQLYANFDGATDNVLNVFHFSLVDGATNYFHADALNGGVLGSAAGTWNIQFVLVPGAADSFVCIGGGEGFASGNSSYFDPDWGPAGPNVAQVPYGNGDTSGPGWFNQNPPNLQGRVDANGQLRLGQFVLANEPSMAVLRLKISHNDGAGGGVRFNDSLFSLFPFLDCNGDSIDDAGQIFAGTLSDCDNDLVPDLCEGAIAISESLAFAFSTATPVEVAFTDLPPAFVGTPRIEVEATADLGAANDALIVQLDGGAGTTLFLANGTDCPATPDVAVIERSIAEFNALVADGELRVRVSGFGAVNTANCANGGITVRLVYTGLPSESDCNANGLLDSCEIGTGAAADCNANGIPDACDIAVGVEADCNGNGVADSCETDCNANGIPDDCDLASGVASDCNSNGTPDSCDIASGGTTDLDGNGVPDDCAGEYIVGGSGFASVQAAVDAAPDGATVRIGSGTWGPVSLIGRAITLESVSGAASTTLSGGGTDRVILLSGGAGGAFPSLVGLTIADGAADRGAGVYVALSSPRIADCVFVGNTALQDGGALLLNGSGAEVSGCRFEGNEASVGGAISLIGALPGESATIADSEFRDNGASTMGGAMHLKATVAVDGCVIEQNMSPVGGGIAFEGVATHGLSNSFLCRNDATNAEGPFEDLGGNVFSQDCDADGVCDFDEIAAGDEPDCDGNGVPDSCDIADGAPDCNENGVPDACDLASGFSQDIDANGVPDDCKADCDADGLPDAYELANGLDSDCDANGTIDWCDLAAGAFDDDGDGRLDVCEYARGDFNLDGFVNGADLAPLLSLWGLSDPPIGDLDGDGLIGGADLSILLGNWGAIAWPPVLSRIAPREGPAYGGTVVVLEGAGLGGATAVRFGGTDAGPITTLDGARISMVAPAHAEGLVAIEVVTVVGAVTVPAMFRYTPVSDATPAWATLVEAVPDPAIVYDAELRAAITATGWAWKVRDIGTGIEMLLIPPGNYDMGCSASNLYGCYNGENPVHPVTITQPFYMSRTEVTQAQWTAVMGSNPSYHSESLGFPNSANRPVEMVSWNTIQGFLSSTGMRLPTEAEWEYAYRAGTTTAFHGWAGQPAGTNDDNLVGNIAWYASSETRPVGGKAANGFGLYDMAGNVWEWVSDWYSGSYYASSPLEDPQGPTSGYFRVLRGGSFGVSSGFLLSSFRFFYPPDTTDFAFGFRVARAPR
jgi:formylglycine-generating enzyme required for sulfatase activity